MVLMCPALYSFQPALQFMKYFALYAARCGLQRAAQLTRYFKLGKVLSHPQFCWSPPKISRPQKPGAYDCSSLLIERETEAQKSQWLTHGLWVIKIEPRAEVSEAQALLNCRLFLPLNRVSPSRILPPRAKG